MHNLESPNNILRAHLWEKSDTFDEPNHLGSGYKGNQVHVPNFSPHNPDLFTAANIGISMHENFGVSYLYSPIETIGVNPINALNQSSRGNQFQEVAQPNPNAKTTIPNSLSHEEHNFTRATKKTKARGLGWTEARARSKQLRQTLQERVNDIFQQLMTIPNYLAVRNRF